MKALMIAALFLLTVPHAHAVETLTVPADPPLVEIWALVEDWSLDGEADPDLPLMGVIATADVADDGHVFLLDKQLAHVLEIAPDGSYVQTLGRSGQGPGEMEQPNMLDLTADGRIGLVQVFPGKVIFLNRDGTPAGGFRDAEGANPIYLRYRQAAGVHVASSRTMEFPGDGTQRQHDFLRSYDDEGQELGVLLDNAWIVHRDPPSIDEQGIWFPSATWDLTRDGNLVIAPARDEYRLEWRTPDGELLRTVTRPLPPHRRTAAERKKTEDGLRVWGNNVELPAKKTILDTEPMFRALQILDDGTIWVRTCFAERDLPDDVYIRYDVFSSEGEFLKEVRIAHPVDRDEDYWQLLRDGTFLRYENARSALDAMYAGIENNESEEEADDEPEYLIIRHLRRAP